MTRLMALAVLCALAGCGRLPGKPPTGVEVPRPDSVLDPVTLYRANCAGCHGAEGTLGPAIPLADPIYLAIADDDTLRSTIANGRPGTPMSAFSEKQGGMLTDQQVDAIVQGIRERWGSTGRTSGIALPPYAAASPGNAQKGEATYATFCASCHRDGSVTDPSYLSLISDQALRTIVITGRPDFGAPDWRNNLPNRPMSDEEISDVVAWLSSQRPFLGGAN